MSMLLIQGMVTKSLSIARCLLPKPNHMEKPTSTKPHIIETDMLAMARIGGLCFLYSGDCG